MNLSFLSRDVGGDPIQAMPLRKGFVNLDTGVVVNKPRIAFCVSAGSFTITWNDSTTDSISMNDGDSFTIDHAKSLAINSGTFHIIGKTIA
jgi:hypothetical protein